MVIKINFSNKLAYTFIAIGILALIAVGINAYNSGGPASEIGHSAEELELDPLYITSTGVGIGTSSPSEALDIIGNINVDGAIHASGPICNEVGCIGGGGSSSGGGWTDNGANVVLTTSTDNVGIGITPTQKLDVNGNVRATSFLLSGGATIWTSGNDGAGSELDADTLDGKDSAYFEQLQTTDAELIEGINVYWEGDKLCFGDSCTTSSLTCTISEFHSYTGGPGAICKDNVCDSLCQGFIACNGDKSTSCVGGQDIYFTDGECESAGSSCTGGFCDCRCFFSSGVPYTNEIIGGKKCVTFVNTP